jgi:hypothetical protein
MLNKFKPLNIFNKKLILTIFYIIIFFIIFSIIIELLFNKYKFFAAIFLSIAFSGTLLLFLLSMINYLIKSINFIEIILRICMIAMTIISILILICMNFKYFFNHF